MHTLMRKPFVFGLVSFHLNDKVHEVLWLREKFQILSINQISKLVLNLDDKLNNIETVKSVVSEVRVNSD